MGGLIWALVLKGLGAGEQASKGLSPGGYSRERRVLRHSEHGGVAVLTT